MLAITFSHKIICSSISLKMLLITVNWTGKRRVHVAIFNVFLRVSGSSLQTTLGQNIRLSRIAPGPFGNDLENVIFSAEEHGDDVFRFTVRILALIIISKTFQRLSVVSY